MKKLFLILLGLLFCANIFAQSDKIITLNSPLVKTYLDEYIYDSAQEGLNIGEKLLDRLDYIIIAPSSASKKICNLGETNLETKIILLDNSVTIDRLILKITLYRELTHVLGAPYDQGTVIMDREKPKDFSYAAFDDPEIMSIEFSKLMELIK